MSVMTIAYSSGVFMRHCVAGKDTKINYINLNHNGDDFYQVV